MKKLPYHRRKYERSIETRGRISCCTPVENSQLYPRCPNPVRIAGSKVAPGTALPKAAFAIAAHSPLAAGLVRLHCGMKSWFASVHDRVVDVMIVLAGLGPDEMPPVAPSPTTYLFRDALNAVLPLPNTS